MNTSRTLRSLIVLAFCSTLTFGLRAQSPAEDMAAAADHFLASLSAEQRAKATFGFGDNERTNWFFVPHVRKGLPLKEMSPEQKHLALGLFNITVNQRTFLKGTTIMSLEQILKEQEKGSGPTRDPELYFVSVFGKPEPKGTWGWRWEGHHLAFNFTVVKGEHFSVTPSFLPVK